MSSSDPLTCVCASATSHGEPVRGGRKGLLAARRLRRREERLRMQAAAQPDASAALLAALTHIAQLAQAGADEAC